MKNTITIEEYENGWRWRTLFFGLVEKHSKQAFSTKKEAWLDLVNNNQLVKQYLEEKDINPSVVNVYK